MSNLQDKQVSSIFRTTNFERYKFNSLQRVIKEKHVRNLIEKMRIHGYLANKAISVNERNEIIDGHHRYLAAKNLGIPMLVQVCKGMKEDSIIEANQDQVNWDKHDFTNTYAKKGNINYIELQNFMVKYPKFKMTQSLILLMNEPNAHPNKKTFQSGEFKALLCCEMRCKEFSFEEFIDKLSKFPDKLTPSITTKGYLEKFEEVYNYHRNKKHQIKLSHLSADFEK